MQNLKNYLLERKNFLQEIAAADQSEDCITVMGQLHELKTILLWIEEHEHETEKK